MNIQPVIYLDYNATTPVAPEVMNDMLPYHLSNYGNPSSSDHLSGWQAKEALEQARETLLRQLAANNHELVFTGGATESINMVLRGFRIPGKNHIITVKTEHNAVLDTCQAVTDDGVQVTYLNVDEEGLISLDELEASITNRTLLVSVMWVNNETGVIQPIDKISEICQKHNVALMTDATQGVGKLEINLSSISIDFIMGSAHKIYGPKGVGFLAIDKQWLGVLQPIMTGGGQEAGRRPGTINLPSIIGLSRAVELANQLAMEDSSRILQLRDKFERALAQKLPLEVNGSKENRLYNTANLRFPGVDSERLMQVIGHKVAASRGSACSTGEISPSHVLKAMGIPDPEAHASIRFSLGRYTTEKEIDLAINHIVAAVESISRS